MGWGKLSFPNSPHRGGDGLLERHDRQHQAREKAREEEMARNEKLDLLMELCGLGQNELADLCGMDKAAMSRIVNGKTAASGKQRAAITRVLEERMREVRIDSAMVFGT